MSSSLSSFGNPQALYDPEYNPPKLLHRTKELKNLLNLFQNSLISSDLYNVNAYIYGMRGIGKSVFTRYFINLLKLRNGENFNHIYLNMAIKSPIENLRLLLELYSQSISNNKFTYPENTRELWSYFHFLRRKSDIPLILILDNMDYLNQPLIEKFIRYSKALKISTIVTSRIPYKIYKKNSKLIAEFMDFPLKLDVYTSNALLDILSQRISLALPIDLDPALSQYIIDIVTHFDHYRPSTCINILKTIYQHMLEGDDITATLIRESSTSLLEFHFQDDLDSLIQFDASKVDFFYLPLLEKLAIFFQNTQNVYISHNELFGLYKMACDELMSPYKQTQFQKFVDRLIHDGFLYPSNIHSMVDETLYFIVLNPERILEYLEIKFSSHF